MAAGRNGGPLTVSLWLRADKHALNSASADSIFHYLISQEHSPSVPSWDSGLGMWYPNQLQLFLPSANHLAHGVARAILRDSRDFQTGNHAFLDSDGVVSFNGPRSR